jgi:hypothetical protein
MDILHNTIYVQTPPLLQDLGSRGIRLLSIPDPAESGTHRSQNKQTQNLLWRGQIPRGYLIRKGNRLCVNDQCLRSLTSNMYLGLFLTQYHCPFKGLIFIGLQVRISSSVECLFFTYLRYCKLWLL